MILLRSLYSFLLFSRSPGFPSRAPVLPPWLCSAGLSVRSRTKALRTGNRLRCREGRHLLSGEAAGMSYPGTNHHQKAAASTARTQLTRSFWQPCRCVAPHSQKVPMLDRCLSQRPPKQELLQQDTSAHPLPSACQSEAPPGE